MYILGEWVNPGWPEYDWSKLRISDGRIHYRVYQQDGTMTEMVCADTPNNRRVVEWIQIHDRYTPADSEAERKAAEDAR